MALLAAGAWTLDVAFFVILLLGMFAGVALGFMRCVSKIVGTIVSLVLAGAFCVAFKNNLESWFGLQTALAEAIGSDLAASILSTVIAFLALVILIRLAAWGVGCAGTALVGKSKVMSSLNRFLGGIMGAVMAAAFIFLLLAMFYWIDAPAVNEFIGQSRVVGAIYNWDYFRYAAQFSYLKG